MFSFMDGYKAKAGGVGLMLLALGTAIHGWATGTAVDWSVVASQFLAGLGVFGIRAALEKAPPVP